jgi:hypothetical protein
MSGLHRPGRYYDCVKGCVLRLRRRDMLLLSDAIGLTPINDQDLVACRQMAPHLYGGELYVEKVYYDELLRLAGQVEHGLAMLILAKDGKGQVYLSAVEQWLSVAIIKVHQPIESLFNWSEKKTGI